MLNSLVCARVYVGRPRGCLRPGQRRAAGRPGRAWFGSAVPDLGAIARRGLACVLRPVKSQGELKGSRPGPSLRAACAHLQCRASSGPTRRHGIRPACSHPSSGAALLQTVAPGWMRCLCVR